MGRVRSCLAPDPGLAGRMCDLGSGAKRHGTSRIWARTQGNWITCREGELDLLLDHLESHKVMLLIEAPVIQQQPITLLGGKPEWELGVGARNGAPTWMPASQPPN